MRYSKIAAIALTALLVALPNACGSDSGSTGSEAGTDGRAGANPDSAADATSNDGSSTRDATSSDTTTQPPGDGSANGDGGQQAVDATTDASAGDGRVPLAPHCTRADDAGWPAPFDAGAVPDVISLPQLTNPGGPVLHNPTFISVTFPGEPYADELNDFVSSIGCTSYWAAVGSDYGVGEAIGGTPVRLTEQAPSSVDDNAIATWLAGKINSGDPLFPRPVPETVYVLWYPITTSISFNGQQSCVTLDGYHNQTALSDGTIITYAVLPRCTNDAGDANNISLAVTPAAHELVEACTDPQPRVFGAYEYPDPNHFGAFFAGAIEIADLCQGGNDAFIQLPGYPWPLPRAYSNHAAWQGLDPCVPAPSTDYFYAAPIVPNTKAFLVGTTGHTFMVQAADVTLAVGASTTIGVRVVSTVAGGIPIQVYAFDNNEVNGNTPNLVLNWQTDAGQVSGQVPMTAQGGDTLQLHIQKSTSDPSGAEAFWIVSHLTDSTNRMRQSIIWGMSSE